MTMKLYCKDLGTDCPHVSSGETEEEVMMDMAKHAKEVHNYTDEQLNEPKMMETTKKAIRKE